VSDINAESWQLAMDWVMREHETQLTSIEISELRLWLAAGVANAEAYRAARDVWLITGCIPHSKD
jgi:ferric-dicitrate binding protein FerR (iron transport regulator)